MRQAVADMCGGELLAESGQVDASAADACLGAFVAVHSPLAVLLVQSDAAQVSAIRAGLARHGARVTHASWPQAALDLTSHGEFDAILLDLPASPWERSSVFEGLRRCFAAPVIALVQGAEQAERAVSQTNGADDYIMRPFSLSELLARVRFVIRRERGSRPSRSGPIRIGSLLIHEGTREAWVAGKLVALTSAEFDLLCALAKRPGCVLSRERLLRLARGREEKAVDRLIDVQVSRLRQKLAVHPESVAMIRTVRCEGYMLVEPS